MAAESDLTRLVRTILRLLKRDVHPNAALSTSVDFDDTPGNITLIALATLPAITLAGPVLRANRLLATLYPSTAELPAGVPPGTVVRLQRPPAIMDVELRLTVAAARMVELLELAASLVTFFERHRWINLPADAELPNAAMARFELDPVGELRFASDTSKEDVRVFIWGLVVRGFEVAQGQFAGTTRDVVSPEVEASALPRAEDS